MKRSALTRLVPRPTYGNVIATVALFVALGGVAVAAGLPKNSVGANQLKRGAVTPQKIRKQAVTSGKLAPQSVTACKLGANAVLPGNLGNGIISTQKIAAGAVIASTIKNGVVTTNKLTNANVTAAKLADNAVTTAKLAEKSVTPAKLSFATSAPGTVANLAAGQTERGVFFVGPSGFKISTTSQSFALPLSAAPAAPKANILATGATTTACPGITATATPTAAAGQLCVYITSKSGEALEGLEFEPEVTNRLGFGLKAGFLAPSIENAVRGQWAVTAP